MGSMNHHRLAIACLLFFGTIHVVTGCAPKKVTAFGGGLPTVTASPEEAAMERQMFERLNSDRAARGLPALSYDERLADIARYHAKDMRDAGFFGHDSPTTGSPQDRVDKAGLLVLESRENVAQAPDVTVAQDQLLASPGHYANIVATSVTHVGIGVVKDKPVPGQVQGYYFTQLFAKPASVTSPNEARGLLLDKVAKARRQAGLPPVALHPLLEELAKEHVDAIDPDQPNQSLGRVGDMIVQRLNEEQGHGLRSVEAAAQVGLTAEMFDADRLAGRHVNAVGFAVAQDEDKQGKPVLKLLFISASR